MSKASNKKKNPKAPLESARAGMDGDRGIRVGIIGGAGYTGGELIRLLINHPHVSVSFIHSRSNAGKPVYSVHQDLLGETELKFTDELSNDIDVLFLMCRSWRSKKIS